MTFDGEKTVEVPLGDFFGTAPGLTPYESLPLGIRPGDPPWMWSHWRMPFRRTGEVVLRNFMDRRVEVKGKLGVRPYRWTSRSLLFHAKWRIQRDLPARPFSDWTHLSCQGRGRFVGGALHVVNPVKRWWGEGDEKIYVDGETFPSHFGTGSEDYYGYAWCCNEPFQHAYHNQTRCDGPGNFGHTSVNRFHILDDIPFTRCFRFDMENWHSDANAATTRAAVSYWYARPGGKDFFKPLTAADLTAPKPMVYRVRYVPGAIEGEKMREITVPGNCTVEKKSDRLSGEEHLKWESGHGHTLRPGDKLVLGFRVPEAGRRHVLVRLGRDKGYARVQLYINDVKAGDVIDLYAPRYRPTEELDLGAFDLVAGENRLTVEIVGANEQAAKNYQFAIDYLKLR